jgi:hypothetical protein
MLNVRFWMFAALMACGPGTDPAPNPVSDAGEDSDARTSDVSDVVEPDVPDAPDARQVALLVDFEMRPAVMWGAVTDGLEEAGWQVRYRRWYPHVTAQDVEPGTYELILVAAGRSPAAPSPRMRMAELDNLEAFSNAGGGLVLLTESGWEDTIFGENEWFVFNRLLERLQLPVRAARNTLVGNVWLSNGGDPPLHEPTPYSYPGSLEWTLDLSIAHPVLQHPALTGGADFALGWAPTLVCEGDDVAVLAHADARAIVWQTLDQGANQIVFPEVPMPIAAVTLGPGGGPVALMPVSAALLSVHTERASDEPALNPELGQSAGEFTGRVLGHVASLVDDPTLHEPLGGCSFTLRHGMFSVEAEGYPARNPFVMSVRAHVPPSSVELPLAPPSGDHMEMEFVPSEETAVPDWFVQGKAHLGYSDFGDGLPSQIENATAHGMNAFMISVHPPWMEDDQREPYAAVLDAAEEHDATIFFGAIAVGLLDEEERAGAAKPGGANGEVLDVPAPTGDVFWDAGVEPFVMGVARAAAADPRIRGVHLDLELYGASSLSFHRGHLTGPAEWAVITAALGDGEDVPGPQRLTWLVDRGYVRTANEALADAVADRARALRDAARAIAPDLEFMLYSVSVSTGWFYEGLMRGLGTVDRPVVLLSYDLGTTRVRDDLAGRGIHARILGGILGVRLEPQALGQSLAVCAEGSDGYWLFKLQDFPATDDDEGAARLHGTPTEYWDAIAGATQ